MLGGISIWQLVVVLIIIILIFGTKKLRNIGTDLGGAIKNFKAAVNKNDEEKTSTEDPKEGRVIEGISTTDSEQKQKTSVGEREKK